MGDFFPCADATVDDSGNKAVASCLSLTDTDDKCKIRISYSVVNPRI